LIIHLNGLPGIGKLTIARVIVARLGGYLLDSHAVYNVAFCLTEFRTPEFYSLVRSVRNVAYEQAAKIPANIPVVLTNALWAGSWGQENWEAVRALARQRGCPLLAVTLSCSRDEHIRRVTTSERSYLRKLTDPSKLRPNADDLLEHGAEQLLRLDSTGRLPEECADQIIQWVRNLKETSTTE
jgi:predicted kinase